MWLQVPLYQTAPPPGFLFASECFYFEAPLKEVEYAQLCLDESWCLGIIFQYQKEVRVIGKYRFDRDISTAISHSGSIRIVEAQDDDLERARVEFETKDQIADGFSAMEGLLVW